MEFTLDGKLRAYGRPTDFTGAFPFLYRNEGNGTFTDVSETAGVQVKDLNTGVPLSKSLGTTFCDVNADGLLDIIVANDTVQNLLFLNQPGGAFIESAATAGIAFDNSGAARGAMGIDTACFRNSDAIGIAIGNFATEMTALYVCQTPGAAIPIFRDEAVSNGIGPVTRTDLKFGVLFMDADLDGRVDLFENNGHLEEDIRVVQASQQYEQPPHLLWNCGTEFDNEFIMLPEAKTGADFQKRMVGRGASMADIDADGDLDLILFCSGGKPRLLRNDQKSGHHWLRLRLRGTKCNKDAIGAVVEITLPDKTVLTRTVDADSQLSITVRAAGLIRAGFSRTGHRDCDSLAGRKPSEAVRNCRRSATGSHSGIRDTGRRLLSARGCSTCLRRTDDFANHMAMHVRQSTLNTIMIVR